MNRPEATTPKARSGSWGVERESLLGRLSANWGVKAMIGAAVLSTALWLAGCGSSDAGAGSNGQTRSQSDTANGAPDDPGTQGASVVDQEKLQTAEGRVEVFETQGTAMMLKAATAIGNDERTVKWTPEDPDAYEFRTDPDSLVDDMQDNPYFTEALIGSLNQQLGQSLSCSDPYGEEDVSPATQYEDENVSSGCTDVSFSIGGAIPESTGTVDVSVTLIVPETILEQYPTLQSLRENLESNEDAVTVQIISFDDYDSSRQEKVTTSIRLDDGGLVMEQSVLTNGNGIRSDGEEVVDQAEPFGELMSPADKILTDLIAQM